MAYRALSTLPMAELLRQHRQASQFVEQTAILMIPDHNHRLQLHRAPILLQLLWERKRALPRNLVSVHVLREATPFAADRRIEAHILEENGNGRVVRVEMRFGFMETVDVEHELKAINQLVSGNLAPDYHRWNVHVAKEHLLLARGSNFFQVAGFRIYQALRSASQPTYYHYGLGQKVPLSVEIIPVRIGLPQAGAA